MDDYLEGMNEGELELYHILKVFEDETFKVLPNVLLKRHSEGTNQMDLIAITKKGVFVFEMKDYSGWIFGDEDNKEWTQMLNNGRRHSKKFKFKNPVKQNDNHIKTIKHLLNSNAYYYPVFNVVVFGKNATLKEVTTSIDVVTLDNVYSVIKKYPDVDISIETIESIVGLIKENALIGNEAMADHIAYAKSFNQATTEKKVVQESVSSTVVKKSNSNKILAVCAIIVLSVWIASMQPFMMLFLFAMFVPKGRRRRKSYYSINTYLIFVLILFAFSAYLTALDLSPNTKRATGTQLISVVDNNKNKQNNPEVVGTTEWNVTENLTIIQTFEEVATSELNQSTTDAITELFMQENSTSSEISPPIAPQSEIVPIILGSNVDDIVSILGEPDKIDNSRWYYQNSYFVVDTNGMVTGWNNVLNQLSNGLYKPSDGIIDIGSNKADVLSALGSPTEIEPLNQYRWGYLNSYVLFSESWKVIGWKSVLDQLDYGLNQPGNEIFELGSSRDEVIRALGSPTEIIPEAPYKFKYLNSYVLFNESWNVIGWNSVLDQLKVGLYQPGKGVIDIGSTIDEVLLALGSPTEISSSNQLRWNYLNSYVLFDEGWKVIGWNSVLDQLKVGLQAPGSGTIGVGSSRSKVISILGSPTEINPVNPNKLIYLNSYIQLNSELCVESWSNILDQLSKALGEN